MRRRRLWITVLACIAAASLAACSSGGSAPRAKPTTTSSSTPRPGADGALVIGQLAPFSGPVATIAESFTAPVRLAVDEMNFNGGVNGKPVGLAVADDGSAVAPGSAAFGKLVDTDHVDAVVGPSTSQLALALIDANQRRPVVICSGSNTYGPISNAAGNGFYFRTAPSDRLQAAALARLIAADGRHRPVVFAAKDSYGEPFATELVRDLRARQVTEAAFISLPPPGKTPAAAVDRALGREPDAFVLLGFPTGIAPVVAALVGHGKGPNQIPTYGSDGLQSAELGALVDPANPAVVAGLKGTSPAGAPAGIDHPFNARLAEAGVEPFFSASTYDCAILIGLAAVAARSDEPSALRDQFARNLSGRTRCSTFFDCVRLVRAGRTIHYQGASSSFDQWQRFEPGSGVFDVWTIGLDARPGLAPATSQLSVP